MKKTRKAAFFMAIILGITLFTACKASLPTSVPTDTPVPTAAPSDTPSPTALPTDTPVPTNIPTDTPIPTKPEEKKMITAKDITVNTQSSIRVSGSKIIYFDPLEIKEAKNDADIVFITHEHYDHFSPDDLSKVLCKKTKLVIPNSMKQKVMDAMLVTEDRLITMAPYEVKEIDGISINAIPAYNVEKTFHPKKNNWLGYKVTIDGTVLYVAGDTDAENEISLVRCDIALIPIGGKYTFDYTAAAKAVNAMKPKAVIPTHYGTIVGNKTDGEKFKQIIDNDIEVVLLLK